MLMFPYSSVTWSKRWSEACWSLGGEIILLIFVWLPLQLLCCSSTLVTHILTWASALKSPLPHYWASPSLDIKLKSKMADCPKSGIQICYGSNFSRHYPCVAEHGRKIQIPPTVHHSGVAFVGLKWLPKFDEAESLLRLLFALLVELVFVSPHLGTSFPAMYQCGHSKSSHDFFQ